MKKFSDLGIPSKILGMLDQSKYINPTPVQEAVIPIALDGRDVLGSAQTGTGKTAAFGIPAIAHLLKDNKNQVLILLPTRELASQVLIEISKIMGKDAIIPSALLIGGDSMEKQLRQIKAGARLVVGTPGRINDHLKQKTLKLTSANMLVLDETDRMLDMGFGKQLETIVEKMPKDRQTLMLSATFPKNIMELAGVYLSNPERVAIGEANVVTDNITQELIHITDELKYAKLVELLDKQPGSVLVFVKTKHGTDRLMKKLHNDKFFVCALHGDMRQAKRDRMIAEFRSQKCLIMVATDIAARGLDISHIETVINYDLPQAAEDYIHRIGRTARAGANGAAINLLTEKDYGKWKDICKLLKIEHGLPNSESEDKKAESSDGAKKKGGRSRRPRGRAKKKFRANK